MLIWFTALTLSPHLHLLSSSSVTRTFPLWCEATKVVSSAGMTADTTGNFDGAGQLDFGMEV